MANDSGNVIQVAFHNMNIMFYRNPNMWVIRGEMNTNCHHERDSQVPRIPDACLRTSASTGRYEGSLGEVYSKSRPGT